MGLTRGDIIVVAVSGEFGKPRPALIVQADMTLEDETVTYVPITSDLLRQPLTRIAISPSETNGLRKPAEIMVDRIQTCTLARVGGVIGHIDGRTMKQVETALMIHLGLV